MLSSAKMVRLNHAKGAGACTGPDQSREFNRKLGERGVKYLEAPVQGSHPEVAAGSLVIMVGSDEDPTTGPAWPVLEALGDNPRHMGKVGEAAAIKLAFNQLVASLMVSPLSSGLLSWGFELATSPFALAASLLELAASPSKSCSKQRPATYQ